MDHGQATIGLEGLLGHLADGIQVSGNLMAGQEVMLAFIEVGPLIHLKVWRIAEHEVDLGKSDMVGEIR